MKVFLALRVPRTDSAAEQLANMLADVFRSTGYTPFVAYQEIARRQLTPQQFMPYVRTEISTSDLVIVVYSADLRGGLIEMGIAYGMNIPIWLAVWTGQPVSSSALASASEVIEFTSAADLVIKIRAALTGDNTL